jgi:glycerate-2-kinase
LLKAMFAAVIETAQPAYRVPAFLPSSPRGRTIVMGTGKASAAMTRAGEDCVVLQVDNEPSIATFADCAVGAPDMHICPRNHVNDERLVGVWPLE